MGIASMWNVAWHFTRALKEYLGLTEQDQVFGFLYLGYTDVELQGKRKTPLEEKVIWK